MAVVVLNSQTRMSLWLAAVLEEKTKFRRNKEQRRSEEEESHQ